MKYRLKIKFPCGLEYEEEWTSLIVFGEIGTETLKQEGGCPIHGNKCSKNIK